MVSRKSSVVIMRHGEGEHNKFGYLSGDPKSKNYKVSHLTDLGKKQVEEKATLLKEHNLKITHAFISPLPRTIETFEGVKKVLDLGIDPILDDDLIEVNMGIYEGRNISEFPRDDWWDISNNHEYQGEDETDIEKRLRNFIEKRNLNKILEEENNHVLIITHGSPIKVFMDLFNYPKEKVELAGFRIL